ncbi:C3a anaphylatoxin chemotactic receptor-like [Coregonus clupeaformis]|uniref:G-protein coupled receptors family 1 profile domain-containing protein n=1 Tax=Coregonus suidteri TaxID=861788 RepID=A0AAN8MGD3_9TELE|nr:C3a anaphylatoxin chemotactic receptor-like [Coregonus clupeaformis]
MEMENSNMLDSSVTTGMDYEYAVLDTKHLDIISLVVYCVVFVLGPIGNGLVIYVTSCRIKKTVNSVWFLNLALADFLFTSFLLLYIINISRGYDWPFGDILCKLNSMVTVLNMFASIFLLAAISLDRCLSTWVVVWAHNKRTPGKAEVICVGIWLASLICSLPFTIFRQIQHNDNRTTCSYSLPHESSTYRNLVVFRFMLGFLIPFLVIIGSYVAIWIRARRLQRGRPHRSLRIIVSIVLAFFICWMPFHVFQFLDIMEDGSPGLKLVVHIAIPLSASLAFLNSCLNPILYVFMCDEFQKKLRQSVLLVFENAFAEDHGMNFVSSTRSLSSHLSRISRRSESLAQGGGH